MKYLKFKIALPYRISRSFGAPNFKILLRSTAKYKAQNQIQDAI